MGERFVLFVAFFMPVVYLSLPDVAYSMPNYARQSSVSCFTCHAQPADNLGLTVEPQEAAKDPLSSSEDGIQAGIKTHTAGSSAANASVSGIRTTPVTELYLTKDENYDRGLNGLSGYVNGKGFYAGLSLFSADQSMIDPNAQASPLSVWYRFGVAPKVGPVDLALGVFGETVSAGGTPLMSTSGTAEGTDTIGLDANIKGQIGGVTLNLKAMYLNSISSYVSSTNLKTGRSQETMYAQDLSEGFGAAARLNIRKVFGLSAAYRTYKSKGVEDPTKTNLATVGAWVNISDNITLESQYTTIGIDSDLLTEDSAFTLLFISNF